MLPRRLGREADLGARLASTALGRLLGEPEGGPLRPRGADFGSYPERLPADSRHPHQADALAGISVAVCLGRPSRTIVLSRPTAGDGLADANARLAAWIEEQGLTRSSGLWESYADDPGSTPQSELRTDIVQPVEQPSA